MDTLGQDIRARRRELESGKSTVRLDKVRAVLDVLGLDLRVELRRG